MAIPAIGIDIGGTGIKIGLVDTQSGQLLDEKIRIKTPHYGSPQDFVDLIGIILETQKWSGSIGIGFPTPMRRGICTFHSNLNPEWEGIHIAEFFEDKLKGKVTVGNDVDVAAYAEWQFGKTSEDMEKILFVALGTGVGTSLIYKGQIIEGLELGHIKYKGGIVEQYISNKARKENDMSWEKWARRLSEVLNHYDFIMDVDMFILGGGVSKNFEKFEMNLNVDKPVKSAELQNTAGIIGAAMLTTKL